MNKKDAMIILGTAHLGTTPGKCSPDKTFREAVWSRQMCRDIYDKMHSLGYKVEIDYEPLNPSTDMKGPNAKIEQQRELNARVNYVNGLCKKHGTSNCIYVSIHVDAAGADGKWHSAGGFSVYTSRGKTKSDFLAECIYNRAETNLKTYADHMTEGKKAGEYDSKQRPLRTDTSDGDRDLEAGFFVLTHTNCPAVLIECMFQDNKADVQYLTSETGKHSIARTIMEGIMDYIEKG